MPSSDHDQSTSLEDPSPQRVVNDGTDQPSSHESETGFQRFRKFFMGELPLQNATTVFILINTLDIFMTYILMRFGAIEANPVADFFMQQWGFVGLIAFKLFVVAFVCVIAQVVALKKLGTARGLLIAGSTLVGLVVIYSVTLMLRHYY